MHGLTAAGGTKRPAATLCAEVVGMLPPAEVWLHAVAAAKEPGRLQLRRGYRNTTSPPHLAPQRAVPVVLDGVVGPAPEVLRHAGPLHSAHSAQTCKGGTTVGIPQAINNTAARRSAVRSSSTRRPWKNERLPSRQKCHRQPRLPRQLRRRCMPRRHRRVRPAQWGTVACRHAACLARLVAVAAVEAHDDFVLLTGPLAALDGGVEVVVPPAARTGGTR